MRTPNERTPYVLRTIADHIVGNNLPHANFSIGEPDWVEMYIVEIPATAGMDREKYAEEWAASLEWKGGLIRLAENGRAGTAEMWGVIPGSTVVIAVRAPVGVDKLQRMGIFRREAELKRNVVGDVKIKLEEGRMAFC